MRISLGLMYESGESETSEACSRSLNDLKWEHGSNVMRTLLGVGSFSIVGDIGEVNGLYGEVCHRSESLFQALGRRPDAPLIRVVT